MSLRYSSNFREITFSVRLSTIAAQCQTLHLKSNFVEYVCVVCVCVRQPQKQWLTPMGHQQ